MDPGKVVDVKALPLENGQCKTKTADRRMRTDSKVQTEGRSPLLRVKCSLQTNAKLQIVDYRR